MYYIGLISGTSMDAIDAALVNFSGTKFNVIHYSQLPISPSIQHELFSVNSESNIASITRLDIILGRLFAEAVQNILKKTNTRPEDIQAIGCHGQTVLHRPEAPCPTSLQIGDPNLIAHLTGINVVADFRRMDMAAGGQGAPLAPIFHTYAFRQHSSPCVVLNIGGMSNITCLPSENDKTSSVTGFDTGPGNVLLDGWIGSHLQLDMDKDGKWAASGKSQPELLKHLMDDDYFKLAPPKSTGRDYFNLDWLMNKLESFKHKLKPEDVQATLVELTATSIATAIEKYAAKTNLLIVCGGGAHNPVLMDGLSKRLPMHTIKSSQEFGVSPDAVEAITFAWLAKCRIEGIATSQPSVTGATASQILGAVYMAAKGG